MDCATVGRETQVCQNVTIGGVGIPPVLMPNGNNQVNAHDRQKRTVGNPVTTVAYCPMLPTNCVLYQFGNRIWIAHQV